MKPKTHHKSLRQEFRDNMNKPKTSLEEETYTLEQLRKMTALSGDKKLIFLTQAEKVLADQKAKILLWFANKIPIEKYVFDKEFLEEFEELK